jgi:hypothetical protein
LIALSKRHGINHKTLAMYKRHTSVNDLPTGPKHAHSKVLGIEDEAIIVAPQAHAAAAGR